MKIEARIFELLTAFFLIGAVVYTVLTAMSSKGVEVGRCDGVLLRVA